MKPILQMRDLHSSEPVGGEVASQKVTSDHETTLPKGIVAIEEQPESKNNDHLGANTRPTHDPPKGDPTITTEVVENDQPHGQPMPPVRENLPRWYPHCCGRPWFRGNKEALGYALDLMARSTFFACAGAFLLPALLKLAKLEAGCEIEAPEGEVKAPECHGKVYGIKPSSLLTTILTIVGVLSASLLPVVGAIVDTTPHRRLIGRILALILWALMIPMIMLNEDNWFLVSIVFIVLGFCGWLHAMVNYAYLPELTKDQDELNELTRDISIMSFSFIVLFLATIVGISGGFGIMDDYVTVAHIAQSLTFGLFTLSALFSWGFLYEPRPVAHEPPVGHSVWTAGFVQLYTTVLKIHKHYPALQWYYIAITLSNAAIGALLVINMTFLTDEIEMKSSEIGACVTLMLLLSIPGAILSFFVTRRVNPIRSSILSLVLMSVVTAIVAIILKEPGQKMETYILAMAWGVAMGWNFTCDRMLISSLVPEGQDTELMGLFLFAGQAFTWLPPLIYTSLNEAGISPRVGIAMMDVFFVLGIVCYVMMGSYSQALVAVGHAAATPQQDVAAAKESEDKECRSKETKESPITDDT
jgi:UMF1 family MFS transporter